MVIIVVVVVVAVVVIGIIIVAVGVVVLVVVVVVVVIIILMVVVVVVVLVIFVVIMVILVVVVVVVVVILFVVECKIGLKKPTNRQLNDCQKLGVNLEAHKGPTGREGIHFRKGPQPRAACRMGCRMGARYIFHVLEMSNGSLGSRQIGARAPKSRSKEPADRV